MTRHKANTSDIHADLLDNILSDISTDSSNIFPTSDLASISDVMPPDSIADASSSIPLDKSSQVVVQPSTKKREALYKKFAPVITPNISLDRSSVSNQANKKLPFYGWFRYKEGFSEPFVDYVISHILKRPEPGILLDPFSGAGSALLAASLRGWRTRGIEVLPVGVYATHARFIAEKVDVVRFRSTVAEIICIDFLDYYSLEYEIKHIAITNGAFPQIEERQLVGYVSYCNQHVTDESVRSLLLYAAICILEEISYTRKDGQYLRWDVRSGRSQGEKPFNKGRIYTFHEAIKDKLKQMVTDLGEQYTQQSLFAEQSAKEKLAIKASYVTPELYKGSCLAILPLMDSDSIDAVLTSPPYANRYDYTRTYALELVYPGCNDGNVKQLRQDMLSCTVENKSKQEQLYDFYKDMEREVEFNSIESVFYKQEGLQEILDVLDTYQAQGILNNAGIASLVRNYFYEMCFVVYELARILKPGGTIVMVNDNVRYAGEEVPVDDSMSSCV